MLGLLVVAGLVGLAASLPLPDSLAIGGLAALLLVRMVRFR